MSGAEISAFQNSPSSCYNNNSHFKHLPYTHWSVVNTLSEGGYIQDVSLSPMRWSGEDSSLLLWTQVTSVWWILRCCQLQAKTSLSHIWAVEQELDQEHNRLKTKLNLHLLPQRDPPASQRSKLTVCSGAGTFSWQLLGSCSQMDNKVEISVVKRDKFYGKLWKNVRRASNCSRCMCAAKEMWVTLDESE